MLLPCPGGVFLPYTTAADSWSSTDPRVSLQFRPAGNWLTYATFSTGFKSGGFNARPADQAAARQPFDMERLHAIELGAKGSFADGRGTLALAAFKYNYDNLQMVVSGLIRRRERRSRWLEIWAMRRSGRGSRDHVPAGACIRDRRHRRLHPCTI